MDSLLILRRSLHSQVDIFENSQRENIFQTRCSIQGKTCALVIDSGSCTNLASTRLVSKLNLDTKPHPQPYKLQWLNEGDEVCVSHQVEVNFNIGKYEDKVLCDIVPMEDCHILLGRPWQYDTRAIHDCFNNKFSFVYLGKKIALKSLSPKEVHEDRIKLREKIAQERREREKELERIEVEKEKERRKKEEQEKESERKSKETLERKKSCVVSEVKREPILSAHKLDKFLPSVKSLLQGLGDKRKSLTTIKEVPSKKVPRSSPFPEGLKHPYKVLDWSAKTVKSFESLDLRTNPFQEGGNDENPHGKNLLEDKHSLMLKMRRFKRRFMPIVFDPGG